MKYIDEFRNKNLIRKISAEISGLMPEEEIRLMEVCGTHTQSFYRFGLDKLLPDNLCLIAGPGCPVCVSSQDYIDRAIELSSQPQTIILSFGDMVRVPGTNSTLEKRKAAGGDVRIIYSAWDSLTVAKANPGKKIVLLAVGFETTAPTFALTLLAAQKEKLKNLLFFSALKLIPPAMKALVCDPRIKIHGFLCPGHVSAIIGSRAYEFITRKYKIACCVTGFEPADIMEGIYFLLKQIREKKSRVDNQYMRVVKRKGNPMAVATIKKVFRVSDCAWRGLGMIPKSGLKLRNEYLKFDAERQMPVKIKHKKEDKRLKKCRCHEVLKGIIRPSECILFRRACRPDNPYGACMVSREGACNAYYRYRRDIKYER